MICKTTTTTKMTNFHSDHKERIMRMARREKNQNQIENAGQWEWVLFLLHYGSASLFFC